VALTYQAEKYHYFFCAKIPEVVLVSPAAPLPFCYSQVHKNHSSSGWSATRWRHADRVQILARSKKLQMPSTPWQGTYEPKDGHLPPLLFETTASANFLGVPGCGVLGFFINITITAYQKEISCI
jgi:hypothetical protein